MRPVIAAVLLAVVVVGGFILGAVNELTEEPDW